MKDAQMAQRVLIVDEIASEREELARALEAEGFLITQVEKPSEAVRIIWEESYLVVFIASILTGTNAADLSEQLQQMAPEIETVIHSKSDERSRLVRKAIEIRDGVIAA
jgi:DNA-binding NtrC family response regulator